MGLRLTGAASIEQSSYMKGVQLKSGSEGVSIILIFLMDLVVR